MILSAERRAGEIEGRNVGEEHRRDEGERARREQTLMPPCRPQMLHQLQTSSFLRSPSFPSSRPFANREGETRRHMPYSNLPHPVAFTVSSSLLPTPSALSFSLSPFRRLATRPRGDDIGYTQKKGREETHGRHGGAQRDTNFRLNLTQGAKGR